MTEQYCQIDSLYPDEDHLREYLAQIPYHHLRLDVLRRRYGERTPLHWATRQNHYNMIRIMLESLPREEDKLTLLKVRDGTHLHDTARWNKAEAARAILHGLTPVQQRELMSMQDENGETAAEVAVRMCVPDMYPGDVLEMLLEEIPGGD